MVLIGSAVAKITLIIKNEVCEPQILLENLQFETEILRICFARTQMAHKKEQSNRAGAARSGEPRRKTGIRAIYTDLPCRDGTRRVGNPHSTSVSWVAYFQGRLAFHAARCRFCLQVLEQMTHTLIGVWLIPGFTALPSHPSPSPLPQSPFCSYIFRGRNIKRNRLKMSTNAGLFQNRIWGTFFLEEDFNPIPAESGDTVPTTFSYFNKNFFLMKSKIKKLKKPLAHSMTLAHC